MSVYEYSSYTVFMKSEIDRNKRPGIMSALANSAGCDRTYLSQVLSGKAHLTADHALNLAQAFSLNEQEADYFLLLVLKERSSNAEARKIIEKKMERIRKENLALTKKIKTSEAPTELTDVVKLRYYSSWKFGAIHILTSLPHTRTAQSISQALGISKEEVAKILKELVEMKVIAKHGETYGHAGGNFHIPSDSPLVTFNHLNWRMRAMDRVASGAGVHYSDAFSISAKDAPALTAIILEFVEKLRKKVRASGAEEAHVFCCDFFPMV